MLLQQQQQLLLLLPYLEQYYLIRLTVGIVVAFEHHNLLLK